MPGGHGLNSNRKPVVWSLSIGTICGFITDAVHVDKQFAESILKRDMSSATGTGRLEVEANKFAAALLMPGDILDAFLRGSPVDVEDESSIGQWAKQFLVSKAALQYRIRNMQNQ